MPVSSQTQLPGLLLIGDRFTRPETASKICEAVRAGASWVQLRDHDVDDQVFCAGALRLAAELREINRDILISINTRLDTFRQVGGGLHVGVRGPTLSEARTMAGPDSLLGISIHSDLEVDYDVTDYLIWSPVFPTSSKPGHPGTGLMPLESVCSCVAPKPVIAMGGITPQRIEACLRAGAHGVAVLSGILEAEDIPARVSEYMQALNTKAINE